MEQRNRGIDLLRMTAMWMVVILHILNKGGVLAAAAPLSAGQGTARLLETAAYCAVNCYGLISGYVGVQRRFRYSGALALWLRVAFYTLGITAVFACLMPGSVNGDRVLRAYYLDRDIDKALRRMALEEGKNLTESVNDALRAGLTKYL